MKIDNRKIGRTTNFIHLCNGAEVSIRGVIYDVIRWSDNTFEFVIKDVRKKRGETLDLRFKCFTFDEVQERLQDKRIVKL